MAIIPPQNLEAEKAILGAILIDNTALVKVADTLKSAFFYSPANELIYTTMLELEKESSPIDIITVQNKLESKEELEKCGGIDYILELATECSSSSNISYYADIVKEKFQRRLIILHGKELQELDGNESIEECIKKYDEFKEQLLESTPQDDVKCLGEVVCEEIEKPPPVALFRSGLKTLDEDVLFEKQKLMILSANTSVGKTSLALNLALACAKSGKRVLYNCLEMRKHDVLNRISAIHCGVPISEVIKNRPEYWSKIMNIKELYFDYYRLYSPEAMSRQCLITKPDFLIIDHNMRITTDVDPVTREVQHHRKISKVMLDIAQKLDICVLLICHLNRPAADNKKPTNRNLYGSVAYEQDADTIMLLWLQDECDKSKVSCVITKNRNGQTGEVALNFNPSMTKFS